jgi:hypothetical protein
MLRSHAGGSTKIGSTVGAHSSATPSIGASFASGPTSKQSRGASRSAGASLQHRAEHSASVHCSCFMHREQSRHERQLLPVHTQCRATGSRGTCPQPGSCMMHAAIQHCQGRRLCPSIIARAAACILYVWLLLVLGFPGSTCGLIAGLSRSGRDGSSRTIHGSSGRSV